MKAIFFKEHGDSGVLQYGEIPTPKPKPHEALVRVKAVALNHLDIWIRRGWHGLALEMPHITGADVSGVIEEIGSEGSDFQVGDEVVLYPGFATKDDDWTKRGQESFSPSYTVLGEHRKGGLAEFIAIPVEHIFHKEEKQTFEQAAAPNLVATTTWRMLFTQGKLVKGETILVVGSGGGVNSLSIQLASALGVEVIALCGSKEKEKRAKELGAKHTVLYKEVTDWHRAVHKITDKKGVDLVVDNVGEQTFVKSLKSLKQGGRLVTVGNTSGYSIALDNRLIFAKQLSIIGSTMGSKQDLQDCLSFMKEHEIEVVIDSVTPLSDGIKMLEKLERGEQFGKIVLLP